MKKTKKHTILQILLIVIAILLIIAVLQRHMPNVLHILKTGNVNDLDAYLEAHGTDGRILLILLQVIETLSIVLPALPVYICAGVLFGKLEGVLICYTINLILNTFMFLFGRKMKAWTVAHFDIKQNATISHLVQSAKHMNRVVILMCLIPIVPNGTIPYLSAQTEISTSKFISAVALGSLPSIVIDVFCGDFLISPNWNIIIPIIAVLMVLGILFYIFRRKLLDFLKPHFKKFIEG